MRPTSVVLLAIALLVSGAAAADVPPAQARELLRLPDVPSDSMFDSSTPPFVQRLAALHEELSTESLRDSVARIDRVGAFFLPGYQSSRWIPEPFEDIQVLLTNRRVRKILQELPRAAPAEQTALLREFLPRYAAQYRRFVEASVKNSPDAAPIDLSRISDDASHSPTLIGTRLGFQSLLLAGALAGDPETWTLAKPFLEHPLAGFPIDESACDPEKLLNFRYQPLLPLSLQAQLVYQLAVRTRPDAQREMDLDLQAVLAQVPAAAVSDVPLPAFTRGSSHTFITTSDPTILINVVRAAGIRASFDNLGSSARRDTPATKPVR